MSSRIKRSQIKTFLNTGTVLSPTWVLIATGVTSGKITYSPKTTEETDIGSESAAISVDSYAPTLPLEGTAMKGDGAFDFIDTIRKARSVAGDAETEIVNVWAYKTGAAGAYYAEKQSVSIQVDDFGGDGGQPAKINYTINFLGAPSKGSFDASGLAFYDRPVTTVLTTMVIGALTLSPLFATDKAWTWYEASTAAATVTMASTLVGATIVQKDNAGVTVAQGDPASLSMGVNNLTIKVTVGPEETTYRIKVTRTA